MSNRRAKSPDALARLFLDVAGEVPDDTSLLRMRRISGVTDRRNDAGDDRRNGASLKVK